MDDNLVNEEQVTAEETPSTNKKETNSAMAVVAYFLFFVPLLTEDKNDPFVKFHVKQSLLIVLGLIACSVVSIVPVIGWIIAFVGPMFFFVLWIFGLINAINGEKKELPIIGKYAEQWFKF